MSNRNPIVNVVSICQDHLARNNVDQLLEMSLSYMDRAAGFGPDIVALPETSFQCPPERAQEMIGRLGQWAAAHKSYVVASMLFPADGLTFKSAVLIDRSGKYVGRYDKIHLTEGEVDEGICPGQTDPPVFQTDFGKIAMQICFDANWPETWQALHDKGAKLIFFCSAFPAHTHMLAFCWQFETFIVSSTKSRPSRIYDVAGRLLDESGMFRPWVQQRLCMSQRLFELDYHLQKLRQIQLDYGQRVEVTYLHENDWATIASWDPDVSVEDIIAKYALTPLCDYRVRAKAHMDAARRKLLGDRADAEQGT